MDIEKITAPLNQAQYQAVTAPSQAVLVLAGAGSGKTRVLVHRIAWQICQHRISPQGILAVTFTNKAAKEMRGRIETLLNISAQSMWIGTFHSIAHRLLRRHAEDAKLSKDFQVMDSSDQLRVIKRVLNLLELDEKLYPPQEIQWYINGFKDEGLRADHVIPPSDAHGLQRLKIYYTYEAHCQRLGLVDFAELLLRAHELLRDNDELREHYQNRFQHVHVDEFQDTNTIQYAWLRLLTEGKNNLFIVGDDDQSIYGWRGAKIANMYRFQQQYPNHSVIKLEQNYRSTGNILAAANSVIAKNANRMSKALWTDGHAGEPIALYNAFNERDEARFVVERIRAWQAQGKKLNEVAILYRSNAQSRQFEEQLIVTGLPYRVYGGLRFFDRAEIKNALAYLRLIANRHDDTSFERVINTPTRGIGAKSLDDLRQLARAGNTSLWTAAQLLNSRSVANFLALISSLSQQAEHLSLGDKVELVIKVSGLLDWHGKDKDKGEEKKENLHELVTAAKLFSLEQRDEIMTELEAFLTHAALESGEQQSGETDDCVQLMTLHSAKGLEFELVFLVGVEEGLFPSVQSVDDVSRLEEERRLCYVGITRAKRLLYLTYAESRFLYGRESYPRPSRFLKDIPESLLQECRLGTGFQIARPITNKIGNSYATNKTAYQSTKQSTPEKIRNDNMPYTAGQKVRHEKFGVGFVVSCAGEGDKQSVIINFKQVGVKQLMLSFAKLDVL
jgi:DNA helicase II / ATP-dependent DNA helicase PcrA